VESKRPGELLADPKERAEHIMLVDLARNDVGRVARYNSVRLSDVMHVERYSHVMHIVSNVEGELRPECTALDALRVSIALRTMVLPAARGGAAAGSAQGAGAIDVQAGAGIVADSVPEREFEETLNKARALLLAVQVAERGFGTV